MSEAKKENEKKETTSNNKKKYIYLMVIAVIVILIGIVIALLINKGDDEEPSQDGGNETQIVSDEKSVEQEYGFTKEDAINAVKESFNSDSYEFEAEVRKDNMYIVTVTNPDSETKYTYIVDPNDGSFQMITE